MDASNQRKRQLVDSYMKSEGSKKMMSAEKDRVDEFEKGDAPTPSSATPILSSIIATPPSPPTAASKNSTARIPTTPPINYLTLFNAFRQFLNGYVQAGGDANYANALATCASALPMPPNPMKPMISLSPHNSFAPPSTPVISEDSKTQAALPSIKTEEPEQESPDEPSPSTAVTLSSVLGEDNGEAKQVPSSSDAPIPPNPEVKPPAFPMIPQFPMLSILPASRPDLPEVTSEIQRLREAAFGRYKNVLCVICNEWICSRNRKNHIEAHLNYRPYKCSACSYARRREIFVIQHIKTQHKDEKAEMLSSVDLHVAMEVDRLADECVARTRKLIDSMQEKKDGDFGENKDFDEKALELMMAEEAEKKVVVIESVSEVRPKVANYHRRQRTKVLKKIYDTDVAKQAELKIVKDEESGTVPSIKMEEGFEINIDDLMKMVEAVGENQESNAGSSSEPGPSEPKESTSTQP